MDQHTPGSAFFLDAQDMRQAELRVDAGLVDGFQRGRPRDWFGNMDPLLAFVLAALPLAALAIYVVWTSITR